MLAEVVEFDLVLPVGVCLADIVLDRQVRDLLLDQHHLNVISDGLIVEARARTWVTNVEGASCTHGHPTVRDANIVKDLELVSKGRRLPLHELHISNDVLDDCTRYLGLHLAVISVLHLHIEEVG